MNKHKLGDNLGLLSETKTVTKKQIENVLYIVENIINQLPDKALLELLDGYENDVDKLLYSLMEEVHNIVNNNSELLNSEKLGYLDHFIEAIDENLKIMSYNYFKATVLTNFNQNERNIEWGNLIQLYPRLLLLAHRGSGKSYETAYAFPLWKLYSYNKPTQIIRDTLENKMRQETCLITNESRLVKIHVSKIVAEIKQNDILRAKLNPNGRANLAIESITTETGAVLHTRTYGSFIRGLHVGNVVVDDFPDKSCLYSLDQRKKFKEVFDAEIGNIVEQHGNLVVSGTPFIYGDIYTDIQEDDMFKSFTYPCIMPDGSLLAPDRFTFSYLMKLKQKYGSNVFSREYLVSPLTDHSSLFPYDYLNKSLIGMENIGFVDNIDSFPIKLKRVVIGCDFAISGNISADYTVFVVWGVDFNETYYLLHVYRKQGVSHNEQINKIISLDHNFKPNVIRPESNGFQKIMAQMVQERGLKNIKEFVTTSGIKKDDKQGLPSLSALFERGSIKIPNRNDEETQNLKDLILGEFNSITFNEDNGKLESSDQHDDICMASFFALTELREHKNNFEMILI